MVTHKGALSGAAIDRGWPFQVALRADIVVRDFPVIETFCKDLSRSPRGHSVVGGGEWYSVFCFAKRHDAAAFMERFGGEWFDPATRGRGRNWAVWR